MGATLDADELSYLRQRFKQPETGSENGGKMSVSQVVECIEHLDFIIDGEAEDLVRSVVPAALKADSLSLDDVIKVAAAAKEQEGSGGPEGVSREDSLAELRSSFQLQVDTGEVPEMTLEGAPRTPPELDRNDSLAQLESSFHRQVLSGGIPSMGSITEAGKDGEHHPPSPGVVRVDQPMRRRSVTGSSPRVLAAPVIWQTPARADSLTALQRSLPNGEGPEPILIDIPHRRTSVSRPGGGSLVGLQPAPSGLHEKGGKGKEGGRGRGMGSPPRSPELMKQTSEEELLDTAVNIGLDPVEALNVPKKRLSFTVPKDWSDAAAKESLKALSLKTLREDEEAEADRQHLESEAARQEVGECLRWLAGGAEKNWAIAQAREDGERKAAEATARAERVEASRAQLEVENVLRFVVDTLENDAAIAKAREEAEGRAAAAAEAAEIEAAARVSREAAAREAAELKAAEAARRAEEALRLVAASEQEAKAKEEALREAAARAEEVAAEERAAFLKAGEDARVQAEEGARKREEEEGRSVAARAALEEEARQLRSKLQEAGEEAAERAHEDAEARARQAALEKQQALERGEREARLLREAAESAGRAAEAREAGEREARGWKEKFEAFQKEREEEAKKAEAAAMERQASAVAKAVADARKFEEERRILRAAEEHRNSLEGARVSFEAVDTRVGKAWWQCLVCDPEINTASSEEDSDSIAEGREDSFSAAVDNVKPEVWMRSRQISSSARTLDGDSYRPLDRKDVCAIM